jgi:hypothetical protein
MPAAATPSHAGPPTCTLAAAPAASSHAPEASPGRRRPSDRPRVSALTDAGVPAPAPSTSDTQLLGQLESVLRHQGDAAAAETIAHLATVVEHPSRDEKPGSEVMGSDQGGGTTNEAVALIGRIAQLLLSGGPHH